MGCRLLFDCPTRGTSKRHSGSIRYPLLGKSRDDYTVAMNYQERITIEPGKRGGKPCIRGMRITVYDVLSYLASGMTHEQILADFPSLTKEDILACLSYAADRESHLKVIAQ